MSSFQMKYNPAIVNPESILVDSDPEEDLEQIQ